MPARASRPSRSRPKSVSRRRPIAPPSPRSLRARSRASPADTTTSPLREDACIASFLSRTRSLRTPIDKDTTMNEKNTRDIQLSVELDASPEEVFRAVTVGTEIAKWLAPEARSTAPEGGKKGSIWISWGEGMSAEHELDIYEPPKRVRHPSGKSGETKAPLYADWSIEAREGGKTTLRLVHSGFSVGADWAGEFDAHARGWRLMLETLRQYFARHPHQPAVHLPFM